MIWPKNFPNFANREHLASYGNDHYFILAVMSTFCLFRLIYSTVAGLVQIQEHLKITKLAALTEMMTFSLVWLSILTMPF